MSGSLLVEGSSSEESDDNNPRFGNSSKKLNSLFSISNSDALIGNQALIYKAPLFLEKSSTSSDQKSKKILLAAPVDCFRLIDGKFVSQGRLGLAFLAQVEDRWFQVLIYSADKKPLCRWTLKQDSNFSLKSNYVYFTDDQNSSWSLLFQNEENLINFSALCLIARSDESSSIDFDDQENELNLKNEDQIKVDLTTYRVSLKFDDDVVTRPCFSLVKNLESRKIRLGHKDIPEAWEECLRTTRKSKKIIFVEKSSENQVFDVTTFDIKKIKSSKAEEVHEPQEKPDLMSKIVKIGRPIAPVLTTNEIEAQSHQSIPHCSYVCHCCHCAYYRNHIPVVQDLNAKFDHVISNQQKLNDRIDLLALKVDKVLTKIENKKEES